jgi:hypothetical protein
MSNALELVRDTQPRELTVADVQAQVAKIQDLMGAVLKNGQHYGTIPGTAKPTLLKPGAEKINFLFRIGTGELQIEKLDMPNGHREITIKTPMIHIPTGTAIAFGIGSCSTMESKYRYRNVADYEDTGDPIPADSKERRQEYRKQGYGMKKIGGQWAWVKYKDSKKEENHDIADVYNTVLKMAAKRSYVDGTIKASAASDFFTQDVEDDHEMEGESVAVEAEEIAAVPTTDNIKLEHEIGESAKILGGDILASARQQVLDLRDYAKSKAIDHDEYIAKLTALRDALRTQAAGKV